MKRALCWEKTETEIARKQKQGEKEGISQQEQQQKSDSSETLQDFWKK